MTSLRPSANLVVVTALTLVYVIVGKLGLMLAFVHASATAVRPRALRLRSRPGCLQIRGAHRSGEQNGERHVRRDQPLLRRLLKLGRLRHGLVDVVAGGCGGGSHRGAAVGPL